MQIHEPTREELGALPRVVAITGPTGVGKTALSLSLAQRLGAEIVNLDSVQIYRGLDIGSAKASLQERARVPHHLIDCLDPDQAHNVGDYKARALASIEQVHARGKRVLLVGGTNLYLRVLVHGLLEAPSPDEALRQRHREQVLCHGSAWLHEQLAGVDEELAARLHVNDVVRISRGLEIWEQTGRRLSDLQREHAFQLPNFHAFKLALTRPRAALYERIEQRVERMMERGLRQECEGLFERYGREVQVFKSLGYRQMQDHLYGGMSLEQVTQEIQQATRRYAKQQLGWLRKEPGVIWAQAPLVDAQGEAREEVLKTLERFFERGDWGEVIEWAGADSYA